MEGGEALGTFPDSPSLVHPTTLACLGMADRHLRGGSAGSWLLLPTDLELIVRSAAKVAWRIVAAMQGALGPGGNAVKTGPAEIIAKVKGLYGDRLQDVGREFRVLRASRALQDETLLLQQLHDLQGIANRHCPGEAWSVVISSCCESLLMCTEGSGEEGYLLFDPSARLNLGIEGSRAVRLMSLRAVQLQLLSILSDIWAKAAISHEKRACDSSERDFVTFLVVMSHLPIDAPIEHQARRQAAAQAISKLRKKEKAAAIRVKRKEVELLRRELQHGMAISKIATSALENQGCNTQTQPGNCVLSCFNFY
ncbi:unnamed protein product [Chrysoparadoxa australica]